MTPPIDGSRASVENYHLNNLHNRTNDILLHILSDRSLGFAHHPHEFRHPIDFSVTIFSSRIFSSIFPTIRTGANTSPQNVFQYKQNGHTFATADAENQRQHQHARVIVDLIKEKVTYRKPDCRTICIENESLNAVCTKKLTPNANSALAVPEMQVSKRLKYLICLRWSYTVPVLCYMAFFFMIWMLAVPLKPNIRIVKDIKVEPPEDSFEIRMKNSNFNSDKRAVDEAEEKNEYLVNVNDEENSKKDKAEILKDVFQK